MTNSADDDVRRDEGGPPPVRTVADWVFVDVRESAGANRTVVDVDFRVDDNGRGAKTKEHVLYPDEIDAALGIEPFAPRVVSKGSAPGR
jgi:hypothetical protein